MGADDTAAIEVSISWPCGVIEMELCLDLAHYLERRMAYDGLEEGRFSVDAGELTDPLELGDGVRGELFVGDGNDLGGVGVL